MKELTHNGTCKEIHGEDSEESHVAWEKEQGENKETNEEQELDELVDYDGSLGSSKIPLGINKMNKVSKSTSDDAVKTGHQKGNGMGYYYRRYWGEAYELGGLGREHPSEVSPEEDIDLMSAADTTEFLEKENKVSLVKAIRKASEYGKMVDGSEEELHSEKQRIVEMSEQKMRDVLEVLLSKDDRNNERGLVDNPQKDVELHDENTPNPILNRMAQKFKSACEADGVNPMDVLNVR